MSKSNLLEPWLRETLIEVPSVLRAVLHALQLAKEDIEQWCANLSEEELNARPAGLPSLAFQIRHIAGSIDRLLTYAEGMSLNDNQLLALKTEERQANKDELFAGFSGALESAAKRIQKFRSHELEEKRSVGKKQLPTTVGGLLIHVADHTQRHVGQAITTAKVLEHVKVTMKDEVN
ncbi:MAG TPA: DinB family protein [Terriglobales bacterium]|nr:DinB family protein [Terriglobales bacterium]